MSNLKEMLANRKPDMREKLQITVYEDGRVSSSFLQPADDGFGPRCNDGWDGQSKRDLERVLEQARLYHDDPSDTDRVKQGALDKVPGN